MKPFLLTVIIGQLFISPVLAQHPQPELRVAFVPTPVRIGGIATLYYELYLTNHSEDTIQPETLRVFDAKGGAPLFIAIGAELQKRLGSPRAGIPPGDSSVIYIELALPVATDQITLFHNITFTAKNAGNIREASILGAPLSPPRSQEIVLGNPLKAGPWCAVYHPSWESGHRRRIYTVDGKARIPGRFAIDFIQLDNNGRYASGNEDSIARWLGYQAEVLAVADGTIANMTDTFPESPTLSGHPKYPAGKATGNYICLKIGEDRFVFYEHLEPRSIKVKSGQRVKKGQIIASLGFTGQTTGPHLHLHVAGNDSPLGSEGLPFVFEKFTFLGTFDNFGDFGRKTWTHSRKAVEKEHPAPNSVIEFEP